MTGDEARRAAATRGDVALERGGIGEWGLGPGQIARRDGALIDYLEPRLAAARITLDHAQIDALERLQTLCRRARRVQASRASRR